MLGPYSDSTIQQKNKLILKTVLPDNIINNEKKKSIFMIFCTNINMDKMSIFIKKITSKLCFRDITKIIDRKILTASTG